MSTKKPTPCNYYARIDYIDAARCESAVGCSFSRGPYGFVGVIELSDCNHKVKWDIGGSSEADYTAGLAKLDSAIEILQDARVAFVASRTQWKAERRRRKKK